MDLQNVDAFERLLYVAVLTAKNRVSDADRVTFELETRLQSKSPAWTILRQTRLTASMLHSVITAVNTAAATAPQRLPSTAAAMRQIEPRDLSHIAAIRRGKECEPLAFATLCKDYPELELRSCGIYIDSERNFLAATPDGISQDGRTIIEIKAPSTANILFWDKDGRLKRTHQYYTQIQYQMYVSKAERCIFAVFIDEKTNYYEDIQYDESFIARTISNIDKYYRKVFCSVYCLQKGIAPETIRQALANLL